MRLDLPAGPRGRLLALGLTGLALGALWGGLVAPLAAWHADRAAKLERQRVLAGHLEQRVATLPALRHQANAAGGVAETVLADASDALAAAALQARLQEMAGAAGTILTSAEVLPATAAGAYRQVGVRVLMQAPWPAIVAVLQAVRSATPPMLVDDLQLRASELMRVRQVAMEASFTVLAFRADTTATAAR